MCQRQSITEKRKWKSNIKNIKNKKYTSKFLLFVLFGFWFKLGKEISNLFGFCFNYIAILRALDYMKRQTDRHMYAWKCWCSIIYLLYTYIYFFFVWKYKIPLIIMARSHFTRKLCLAMTAAASLVVLTFFALSYFGSPAESVSQSIYGTNSDKSSLELLHVVSSWYDV